MVTSDKIHVPRGEMEGKMKGDTGKGKQESQRASKSLSNCLRWMNDDRPTRRVLLGIENYLVEFRGVFSAKYMLGRT